MLPSSDGRGGSGSAETRLMNTKWAPIGFTEKSEQTTHEHQSLSIGKGAEVSPPVSLKRDITPQILVIKHRFRLFFCSTALSFCRQAETWESVRLAQQIKVLFIDALSDVQSFPRVVFTLQTGLISNGRYSRRSQTPNMLHINNRSKTCFGIMMSSTPIQPPSHPEGRVLVSVGEPISSQRHVSGTITAPRRVITRWGNEDRCCTFKRQ